MRITHIIKNWIKGGTWATALVAAATIIPTSEVAAIEYDLSKPGDTTLSVVGDFGGTAIFSDEFTQPAGTGVFEPFLTLDANGQTSTGNKYSEQAYNTDGFTALYLDQLRPQWNERVTVGDLAQIDVGGAYYYAFLLDANEPGGSKSLISIDNIRIYTSASDNTASVGDDMTKLNNLGTLRWALNDPTQNQDGSFNIDDWIKLDAAQENVEAGDNPSNGGSGKSDMVVYIPVSAFAGASSSDYLWFYNLNGVHYKAEKDTGSTAGYEEWRAVVGPQTVPDAGGTLGLLAFALMGIAAARRKFHSA